MGRLKDKWKNMPLTIKVSSAYAICSILQRCLSFITLPLFTRLLSTEQYGQVTIYQSWQGILSIFLTLNLAYGSFSTAMVKYEDDRKGYISSVEGICVVLTAGFLLIYLPFNKLWNKLFELPTYIMCIMVVELLGTTALLFWNGKKRFEFKYKAVVAVTLAISVVSPIIQYLLVTTHDEKGYARIIGAAIVNILVGGFFFAWNLYKGKSIFNKEYWKYALGFNIPLLAYYLSQIVFNQSDRIMISHMVGKDKAAMYGVAYSLAMVLTFVLNAINNSYVPWFYGKIKDEETRDNRSVSLAIAGFLALLLLVIIWFAPEIIMVMAGKKYSEAVYVVAPVAMSLLLLFYTQLFANVEFFYEEKHKLVWASIGAAIVNLVLNWIFIRMVGFIAAAYTTLISYVIFAICNCYAMKKVLREKNTQDDGFNYRGLVGLFIAFVIVSYIGVGMYRFIIPRVIICCVVAIILFLQKERIIGLYKTIQSR